MTDEPAGVDAFLADVLPTVHEMDRALHNGDIGPRMRVWSHNDPVTVFGAVLSASGWDEIGPMFERLAERFSNCSSFEYEVVAAGVSGDLGYIAGFEHTTAAIGSGPPERYDLRVTTIFRREDGDWKIVHRHADPVPASVGAERQLGRHRDLLDDEAKSAAR
jgi:ketosteroid isomerase-like protein